MAKSIQERVECPTCGQSYTRSGMGRHLQSCLGPGSGQLLFIESGDEPKYWLFVRASGKATLRDLDMLLRKTWLECCGHMSQFDINGQEYVSQLLDRDGFDYGGRPKPRTMAAKLSSALPKGGQFVHDYDFGSTTRVTGRMLGPVAAPKGETVSVLLRNPMPDWTCDRCDKPPTGICPGCEMISCAECEEGPCECEERWADPLLIVNSPRMGVCGYEG